MRFLCFNIVFITHWCGSCRFSFCFFDAQQLAAAGLVGKDVPRSFGPAATLAHMVERCRFCLLPGLFGPGDEELQV